MLVKDWRSLQIGGIMQVSQYSVAGLTRGIKQECVWMLAAAQPLA